MYSNQHSFHTAHLHAVPGQLRVNVPVVRECRMKAAEITSLLEDIPGVRSVSANHRTGNLLVSFDDTVRTHADLVALLVSAGHLEHHVHPDA